MHGAGARTPAVAALVVVVKAPMLLLHHISLTFFCNDAQKHCSFPVHMISTFCKSRSIQSSAAEAAPLQVVVAESEVRL